MYKEVTNSWSIIKESQSIELSLDSIAFKINDTLLFGRESAGVPSKVHETANEKLKIPMEQDYL